MSPCGFSQHQVPGRSAPAMLPYKPGPAGKDQGLTGPGIVMYDRSMTVLCHIVSIVHAQVCGMLG